MKIRMIGLDLDGTVFDNRKNISARTKNAVSEAIAHGVFVIPITGRPFYAIPENVFRAAPFPCIASTSGAVITDLKTMENIHEDLIANARAQELTALLSGAGFVTMAFLKGRGYVTAADFRRAVDNAGSEIARNYLLRTRTPVPDLVTWIKESGLGVEKVTVNLPHDANGELIGAEEVLDLLKESRADLDIAHSGAINVEITNRTATKGNVLRFFAKRLGIPKEEIMACGDSDNDREMLLSAGLGVAMENAEEKVKKAAGFITKSNEDDGVAFAIEKFVLGDHVEG